MIFKSFDTELDGLSNKLGFNKRSFAEWGKDVSEAFHSGENNAQKFFGALKAGFVLPRQEIKILDTEEFASILNRNPEEYFSKFNSANRGAVADLQLFNNAIGKTEDSVNNYLIDCIQNQAQASYDGYVEYTQKANAASKSLGIGAKAAAAGVKILSTAMSMLANIAISWAIGEIISMISEAITKAHDLRMEAIETGKEASNSMNSLNKLVEKYKELGNNAEWDNTKIEQARSIQEEVKNILGDQGTNIDLVNGKYEQQLATLKKISAEKNAQNFTNIMAATNAAEGELGSSRNWREGFIDTVSGWGGLERQIRVTVGHHNGINEREAYRKVLEETGMKNEFDMGNGIAFEAGTPEKILKTYDKLNTIRSHLIRNYKDEIKAGGDLEDFYNSLSDNIDYLTPKIEDYKNALSSEATARASLIFNNADYGGKKMADDIGLATGALIENEDQMKNWVKSVLESNAISDEVKANLLGLARTTYPELSSAINQSAQAHFYARAAAFDFSNASEYEVQCLMNLASQCGFTSTQMEFLTSAAKIFANTDLNVAAKCSQLIQLAKTAGIALSAMGSAVLAADAINNPNASRGAKIEYWDLRHRRKKDGTKYTDEEIQRIAISQMMSSFTTSVSEFNSLVDNEASKITTPTYSDNTGSNTKGSSSDSSKDSSADKRQDESPVDAIIRRIKADNELAEKEEEALNHQSDMIDSENDFAKAIDITNQKLENKKKQIETLDQILAEAGGEQTSLNNEAEYYRLNDPTAKKHNTEEWFDSQAEATEAYVKLLNSTTVDEEREKIEEVFSNLQKYKKAWLEADEKRAEYAKDLYDLTKDRIELEQKSIDERYDKSHSLLEDNMSHLKAVDNLSVEEEIAGWNSIINLAKQFMEEVNNNTILDDVAKDEMIKAYRETIVNGGEEIYSLLKQKASDYYDYAISKEEALKDLKEKQFDILNKLTEAEKEANKNLRTSLIGSQYLDEETRKLVYNEDDYKKEISAIKDIRSSINSLYSNYRNQIENLTESEWEQREMITAEYERQLAIKTKELEIVQKEVDLQKAKDKLNNVLAEKNVRQIVDGKWEWVNDVDKVREATESLADAEAELELKRTEQAQQRELGYREQQIEILNYERSMVEKGVEIYRNTIEELCDSTIQVTDIFASLSTSVGDFIQSISGKDNKVSREASKGSPNRTSNGVIYDKNVDYAEKMQSASSAEEWMELYRKRQAKIKGEKLTQYYASGTNNAKRGNSYVNELGEESYISKDGTIHSFGGGEVVLNKEQTENLYNLTKLNSQHLLSKFTEGLGNRITQPVTNSSIGGNITSLHGDIIINNPANFNEFTQKLTQAFRRKSV